MRCLRFGALHSAAFWDCEKDREEKVQEKFPAEQFFQEDLNDKLLFKLK